MTQQDMSAGAIQKAYARWAPVYDLLFGSITGQGRKKAAEAANRIGGHVLECGVGTGLALAHYRKDAEVTGIDLSLDMLALARKRADDGLSHVNGILQMDAGRLAFADETFDCVVAMYLITVVPDPEAVMAELARVCRKGGEVVLVNHFSADGGLLGFIEKTAAPFADRLGWRPEFPFSRVTNTIGLELLERKPAGFGGLFTLVRFARH